MQVGNVLISSDLITERFCCDLDACKGACCIEGDVGAPVTLDEIAAMEDAIDIVWNELSAQAQTVIDLQGVACTDREGDLVTSIVNGKDCCFHLLRQGALPLHLRPRPSFGALFVSQTHILCTLSYSRKTFRRRPCWP